MNLRKINIQMGTWITISAILELIVLAGCGSPPSTAAPPLAVTAEPHATPANLNGFSEPYLGQKEPGLLPEIFAPGIVSDPDFMEWSGAFSPDGSEYYFNRWSDSMDSVLFYSRVVDGVWTEPEQLAITAGYAASESSVTFDNNWLYFMWRKPVPVGQTSYLDGGGYYVAERTLAGWSEPKYAGQGMFLSASRDGEIYTTDMSSRNEDGSTYLARVAVEDGVFTQLERLPLHGPFGEPAHPCIAPDGSYMLFDVGGGNHLFASFKKVDGSWGDPIDLVKHGFDPEAGGAYISPDGKYVFFALDADIWWVDAQVIENLRPKE